ncbi:MAG: ATP-NAD kinase [Nitrososphaeria archaeon]|nr:ATP-NAD kinase [Nitrososphaeria archaeon]NIN51615.1 ATP-NAD kinase [Nitrososphaeria archaeon]NIQ32100.1 ATP-NAD kinase [Nitrososphaeria archaeon]
MSTRTRRLGFIVNPIAGIGGRVGLKGSDGEEIIKRALELGAEPVAPKRAIEVLKELFPIREEITLVTYPHDMGEREAKEASFVPRVVGEISPCGTSSEDTKCAARDMLNIGVDLILFVGGDGTARDILDAVNGRCPVLGVPSGVKIYSGVFAINPAAAAEITIKFLRGEISLHEAEVMDIDEAAFRSGRLSASLYGYMSVPREPMMVQSLKSAYVLNGDEKANRSAVAKHVVESMKPNIAYIIGPGTTTKAITDGLGVEKSLLGVDVVRGGVIIAKDVNEESLLRVLQEGEAKIIVTPIGRQGFVFGRGNQQISPQVIREVGRENIIVVATHHKLRNTKVLLVDTGDAELDEELRGYMRVVSDYGEEVVRKIE